MTLLQLYEAIEGRIKRKDVDHEHVSCSSTKWSGRNHEGVVMKPANST